MARSDLHNRFSIHRISITDFYQHKKQHEPTFVGCSKGLWVGISLHWPALDELLYLSGLCVTTNGQPLCENGRPPLFAIVDNLCVCDNGRGNCWVLPKNFRFEGKVVWWVLLESFRFEGKAVCWVLLERGNAEKRKAKAEWGLLFYPSFVHRIRFTEFIPIFSTLELGLAKRTSSPIPSTLNLGSWSSKEENQSGEASSKAQNGSRPRNNRSGG
ncbi:hypothetical protein LR48_Vigan07g196000 [Vigna angularis]|uniref:Uncharacterized protein n=1 Tax=Phaseolus angularis TaxID=3914 RepID=A0A0L9UZX5_PHAAN|nr:hypothetical protein LR48_Vigan07g196000 [Vigna angularis]